MTGPAEAKLQATANLSPVSPSPVHTAAPLVVPALQDTVDTIDAMVAAAAKLAEPNGEASDVNLDPAVLGDSLATDAVDDDSLNDPYSNDDAGDAAALGPASEHKPDPIDTDDYAKTFDSPIEPDEGDGHSVPEQLAESNLEPDGPSDNLNAGHVSDSVLDAPAHAPPSASDLPAADGTTSQFRNQQDPAASPLDPSAEVQEQTGFLSAATSEGPNPEDSAMLDSDSGVDIQQLVADLTSQSAEPSTGVDPHPQSGAAEAEPSAGSIPLTPSTALPSSSSLPPRPPMPVPTSQSFAAQQQAQAPVATPSAPGQQASLASSATPGSSTDVPPSLPLSSAGGVTGAPYHDQTAIGTTAAAGRQDADTQRHWDQFITDERQYMSEAKWDRFPEGSRIFIGNLSSDKVSKRDVFDVFYRYGRLAQISLKSAYGFVQYHTVDEGRQAMEHLQGIEIKGRRIHLEISRAQEKSKKDRGGRSPDRGRGGGRRGDKHNPNRDDYRPGRNRSPRRNDHHPRDDGFSRDHGFRESGRRGRGRSRSPAFGRNDRDSYRRRSPSPFGGARREAEIDLPRRFGSDVPDVQIILQPEVSRDFATWVEGGFKAKGLKTEVMYLHPRIPKDQVVQRQAAEGVHGVVDLDLRAQSIGRIPVQAFDRSGGGSNIRYDQYLDLDPGTAAEVIVRAKAVAAPGYGQNYGATAAYGNPYGGQHQQHLPHGAGYAAAQHAGPYAQPPAQPAAADIASLVGQVDNATLQRLLSSIQGAPGAHAGYGVGTAAPSNQQVDIQAILGSLGGQPPAQPPSQQGQYGAAYGAPPPAGSNGANSSDSAAQAQVQNIMAQLARYRQ